MGKLIKYELRKQRASRMVIFIALAIALVGFWTGILFMNNTLLGVSAAAMLFGAVFVLFYTGIEGILVFNRDLRTLFYTGIEGILVFNRDLRTKQSYMLWMLPRSIWEILGAKFISAILQMLIVFGISCAAVGISTAGAVLTIGGLSDFLRMLQNVSKAFVEGGLNWGDLVSLAFLLFLSWTLIIMTGFLAVILARTVLVKSRFAGLLAVILFFVINFVIERVYDLTSKIPFVAAANNMGALGWNLWDVIFYIIVSGLEFMGCYFLYHCMSGTVWDLRTAGGEKAECVNE